MRSFVHLGFSSWLLASVVTLACSDGGTEAPETAAAASQPGSGNGNGSGNGTGTGNGDGSGSAAPGGASAAAGMSGDGATRGGTAADGTPNTATPITDSEAPAGTDMPGAAAAVPAEMPMPAAPTFEGESCPGCARFAVPMNAGDQFGMFELSLPAAVDMTNTTITWRVMAVGFTGTSGGVAPYVRDEQNRDQCFIWNNLSQLSAWTDITCDFSQRFPGGANAPTNGFDRTTVARIGLQVHSGGVVTGAAYANALVYLDSIKFSDGVTPDITFDAGIGDLKLMPDGSAAQPGTNVAFLGQ